MGEGEEQSEDSPNTSHQRRTSFAQSFFQAGAAHDVVQWAAREDDEDEELEAAKIIAMELENGLKDCCLPARTDSHFKQQSTAKRNSFEVKDIVAAANTKTDSGNPNDQLNLHDSWVREALTNGDITEADLQAFLSDDTTRSVTNGSLEVNGDDEIMEQYKIMAHLEAEKLFQKQTGQSVEEYLHERHQFAEPKPNLTADEPLNIPQSSSQLVLGPFDDAFASLELSPAGTKRDISPPTLSVLEEATAGQILHAYLRSTRIRCPNCSSLVNPFDPCKTSWILCTSCDNMIPNSATRF